MEERYKAEEDKSIIYDTLTDKDVCMYFDEEMKKIFRDVKLTALKILLELLNK